MNETPPILSGAHVLLTGATGFVGQAILEKLLSTHPDVRVSVLVRPRGVLTARQRVDRLYRKPVFKTWRKQAGDERAAAEFADRVNVIEGDLGDVPALPRDLDVVIHSASTVSFDLPIDEAFTANVEGPTALYRALLESGADPHVVHVSTAYVAGLLKGIWEERSLDNQVDCAEELAHALATRAGAEAASRTPRVLHRLLDDAQAKHRRAGAGAVTTAAEEARQEWVRKELIEAGRVRARSLGWPDVYTFTKALGERVAEDLWAGSGHRLSLVRPTIIESALKHPYPGWIDGFKVADPLIAAYGRGLLPRFPALADTVLDVIPVDFVVNAIIAAAQRPLPGGEVQYLQVSSGSTNPLPFGQLLRLVREYFEANPLKDAKGAYLAVPSWSFPHRGVVERALTRRERAIDLADRAVDRLPPGERTRRWISAIYRARRDLGTLRKFTELYQPYTETEVIFDDAKLRALHAELPPEQRAEHGFDVTEIDWQYYLQEIHIPSVPGLTRGEGPSGRGDASPAVLPHRADVMAVFDLQRTVATSTLVEHYLWVELAAQPLSRWPAVLTNLIALGPRYLKAERRDRGDFIRTFMRRYAGVQEDELRKIITDQITVSLHRGLLSEALEQIRAHQQAGHRTVLLTGEIDVFVEPLAPLFDVMVTGHMEADAAGRWTGHLATPPLVGEARAGWLRRYARTEGMDLAESYAYGDSYADRPWLEVVGHPNAVNPDAGLYRYAKARRWPVHSWSTTEEGRLSPVLRSVKGARKR